MITLKIPEIKNSGIKKYVPDFGQEIRYNFRVK